MLQKIKPGERVCVFGKNFSCPIDGITLVLCDADPRDGDRLASSREDLAEERKLGVTR